CEPCPWEAERRFGVKRFTFRYLCKQQVRVQGISWRWAVSSIGPWEVLFASSLDQRSRTVRSIGSAELQLTSNSSARYGGELQLLSRRLRRQMERLKPRSQADRF